MYFIYYKQRGFFCYSLFLEVYIEKVVAIEFAFVLFFLAFLSF